MSTAAPRPEPATTKLDPKGTDVGSVFVSNYPPYSFWSSEALDQAQEALHAPPQPDAPLGLYLHIPFCRRRCKFCYFRVYTDKNAQDIQRYLESLAAEVESYSRLQAVAGRRLKFVYFGGGTPSYIKADHLRSVVRRLKSSIPWEGAEEVTFECEPGTLTQSKLEAIREIGVTRVSLGVEHFDDDILKENGRAHLSHEIHRCMPWIRALEFEQLNIDLISGMVGESWPTWKQAIERSIEVDPDSITIYQMELPFNTVYSSHVLKGQEIAVADWETKRAWHQYAIDRLQEAGYEISSGYTLVKKGRKVRFVYRDSVWQGSDLIGAGVASFGHMSGVHLQNRTDWEEYNRESEAGRLPLKRAFCTTAEERLTRETILQLKLGKLGNEYFLGKFGVDIIQRFKPVLERLRDQGMLRFDERSIGLTSQGLLRVDQLLPAFYADKYQGARYT